MNAMIGTLTAEGPMARHFAPAGDRILGRVMVVLRGVRPAAWTVNPLDAAARLSDAGFTSIDMVKVMLGVEAEFDLMIPQPDISPENFATAQTIAAMMTRLTET